jgi:hypothetical protein
MKKFLSFLIAATLMAGASVSAHASTTMDLSGPDIGVRITENQELLTDGPNLMAQTQTPDGERFYLCKTLDDSICTAASNIHATSFLPPCSAEIDINCIVNVYAVGPNGERVEGIFQRYVAKGSVREFALNTQYNLPQGVGQGAIWTMPGLKNGAGNEDYYVGARFDSWASVQGGAIKGNFQPGRMITGIFPVSTKVGGFGMTVPLDSNHPSNDGSPNGGVGSQNISSDQSWINCVVTENGKCYMAENFPADYRFGLTLRLGATVKGWFHGRIYRPVINVKPLGTNGAEEISIDALPVVVPTLQEKIPTSLITPELRNYLTTTSVGNGFGYVMPESSGPDSFMHTKMWIPLVKDKATTSLTYWSVRTLTEMNDPIIQRCTNRDGALSGVVTTNSLVYNAGPPDFDRDTQNLNYKVLSTHFNADGTVAKGTYDLILSSTVARCIYGFTKAPIQASLSIISEDGAPQVATQTIQENDGWLSLSAAGFTYSSPTIAVKLSQAAPAPEVTPSPTSTSKSSALAGGSKSITCAKGKVKKKVSGVNPKCPTGYKKVA